MEEGWFSQSINLTKTKFEKLGNIVDILQPFNLLDLEVLRSTFTNHHHLQIDQKTKNQENFLFGESNS